jgi:hypothetical protein
MKEIVQRVSEDGRYALDCLSYRIFQGRNHRPVRILVGGTPKTGTTWMMRMITSIPGYRSVGNFHGDVQRYRHLTLGEVVHAHDRFTPELAQILESNHIKAIITFRDPRDQVISRVFHIRRDTTHRWHQSLSAMSMDEALMVCIEGQGTLPSTRSLVDVSYSWMEAASNSMCVRYEDMLQDNFAQFQNVLAFLDIQLPNALLNDIVQRNRFARLAVGRRFWKTKRGSDSGNTDSHFRKGMAGDWHNYFKPEHVAKFKELLGDRLIDLGYERDLHWSNTSFLTS